MVGSFMTLRNARSKAFGSSLVSCSRAASSSRFARSLSDRTVFFAGIISSAVLRKFLNVCPRVAGFVFTRWALCRERIRQFVDGRFACGDWRQRHWLPAILTSNGGAYEPPVTAHIFSSNSKIRRSLSRPFRKSRSDLVPISRSIGQPLSDCAGKNHGDAGLGRSLLLRFRTLWPTHLILARLQRRVRIVRHFQKPP